MGMKFTNNATTALAAGISAVATSMSVSAGTGAMFPVLAAGDYFYCTLTNLAGLIEIVQVTARAGDVFTVVRGVDGTAGLVWNAADKVELRLVAASLNDLPKLDEANTFTGANVLSGVSMNGGQLSGFRNSFINGAYQVNQIYNPTNAATGSAVTVTAGVTHAAGAVCAIDNWYTECTGQNITAQQIAGTAPFKYAYKLLAGATGATTTLHGTRIEGKDCVKDVNQVKGISLWMTHDVARTVTWTAYYANAEDNFSAKTQIATGTISATAARAQYFFSFNAGANAGNGLCIEYTTGALTNSTGYVIYEGHQNERVSAGATAGTSYEHVDYAVVLARCLVYLPYWAFSGGAVFFGYSITTGTCIGALSYLVQPRITPTGIVTSAMTTFAVYNGAATSGQPTSIGANTPSSSMLGLSANTAPGALTVGQGGRLSSTGSAWICATGCQL